MAVACSAGKQNIKKEIEGQNNPHAKTKIITGIIPSEKKTGL
jgi:hypothetical protein